MDSSSVILLAGAIGVASLSVTILYFLYKCLMRETPYQRTLLVYEADSKHKENDKKLIKRSKNTVRQRVVNKPAVEVLEKTVSKEETNADKAVLDASQASEVRTSSESVLGSFAPAWSNGEKADVKKKNQSVFEKAEKVQHVLNAKPSKKSVEETNEVDPSKQVSSGKAAPLGKDDKLKSKGAEPHVLTSDVGQQQHQQQPTEKKEEKKNQLKSKEVAPLKPAKEVQSSKLGKELVESQELNCQQQADKKKKNKKSNEEVNIAEQKVKVDVTSPVASPPCKPVTEEVLVEQKVKGTMSSPGPLQPVANKKKNPKAKASEEFDVAEEVPVIQSELKQVKKVPAAFNAVEVQQPIVATGNNKQQQQQQQQQHQQQVNGNKSSGDLDGLKRLVNEKDAVIQRDQQQLKSLNEALFQLKKELTIERSKFTELENNIHVVNQKHNEEKQTLLNSLHQKDQQSKQAIQLLQQELQALKARPNDLSMIMSNLAEENAKLTAEISHAEKQRNEEVNQRAKTMDLLNDAVRKMEHLELTNKSLDMKFKQTDERARTAEMKQKEALEAVARMEKMYLDLEKDHQHLQMQSQPNLELQNQLRNAKLENEELHVLVARLEKEATDLEKELNVVKDASVVSESIQQSQVNEVNQVMKGCSDGGLLAQLESQLSEQEKNNKELTDKLIKTDKNNQNEEKQMLLNSLLQKDQQSKQAIQLLQQELQALKARPNDLSMIMSNLAEENAKLTAEISHAEKQRNEEVNQRAKTMDQLNDAIRKMENLELTNKSLDMKFKQTDERARTAEMKQKEALEAVARMEKMYLDLEKDHQHLQMQSQPNLELQNQLRNAKLENEELHALVSRLEKEATDLEKELNVVKDASIVSESIQQSQVNEVNQAMKGCSDGGLLAQLESQLSEQEKNNKELTDKLINTDKKNQTLEEERGELLVALEKLKKQVVDLEKELENKALPLQNEPAVEQQNGCLDAELVNKLEASLAEKEENYRELLEKLEVKDKKNEDLRQKNWKAMEALTESEKRLESIKAEHESQLKGVRDTIADLETRLSQAEQKSECVENVKQLKLVARANEICVTRQEDEIATLKHDLQEQKKKNDKLREKNWAVMTSLNDAESKLQDLYKKLERTESQLNELKVASLLMDKSSNTNEEVVRKEYTIVNEVSESCQWDMSQLVLDLDSKTAEIEILQSLLDQHENSMSVLKGENEELKKSSQKEGHVEAELLKQKVEHYKKVLSDTESILRTLEASVDEEEQKWKGKIEKLEKEIAMLRQRAK